MAVESEADRLLFLSTDDFAVAATVGASTVPGILADQYIETLEVPGSRPVFTCRSSDVTAASIVFNTSMVIGGVTYKVKVIQPDGTGMTRLVLEEQ